MFRSWEQRILGGICGGLAHITPLSAWFWRVLFVALAVLTGGWGIAVYVLAWWMLPLRSPRAPARRANVIVTLLLLLFSVAIVVGYGLRYDALVVSGVSLYAPLLALLLATVFTVRQISIGRGNVLWGVVTIASVGTWLTGALGILPSGIYDLLLRSSGALLVFFGLSLFLKDRFRLAGFAALLITVGITAALVTTAFSSRINAQRSENQANFSQDISPNITTLQINIAILDTDVQVFGAVANDPTLQANYVGSTASNMSMTYAEDGAIATLTLQETRPNDFPKLDEVGRATLRVEIPQEVGVFMAFASQNGSANLDLALINLEWVNMELLKGSAVVSFPVYNPLSEDVRSRQGELRVLDGNLRLLMSPDIGAQFLVNKATNQRPFFDDLLYALEDNIGDWRLTSRQFNTLAVQIRYILTVPRGEIRVDNPSGG